MTASSIIQKSKEYATHIIVEKLPKDFVYHDLDHTFGVLSSCLLLAKPYNLGEDELETLTIAALFHDLGYLKIYQGHELASEQMATDFLQQEAYPSGKIKAIVACIHATIVEEPPHSISEQIIKDADLASLGSEKFEDYSKRLRSEWLYFCDELYTDKEWYEINYNFLNNHSYFTDEANRIYGPGKALNLARMKELLEK